MVAGSVVGGRCVAGSAPMVTTSGEDEHADTTRSPTRTRTRRTLRRYRRAGPRLGHVTTTRKLLESGQSGADGTKGSAGSDDSSNSGLLAGVGVAALAAGGLAIAMKKKTDGPAPSA